MERSEFLRILGFGSAGIIIPDTLLSSKPIKIYENYIKGIAHYNYRNLMNVLKEGDQVSLRRETTNAHDSFAIEVLASEQKIGYIAAFENIVLGNMLDQGVELLAFISKINRSTPHYNDVAIEIFANIIVENKKVISSNLLEHPSDEASDIYRRGFYGFH